MELPRALHETALRNWLSLIRTAACCVIETCRPKSLEDQNAQNKIIARLKKEFAPRLTLQLRYRSERQMHDRNVTLESESGTVRVSIPKGLDFIENGIVPKATSITVMHLGSSAA